MDNLQFWYDWDNAGRAKASELLAEGATVFNWRKCDNFGGREVCDLHPQAAPFFENCVKFGGDQVLA